MAKGKTVTNEEILAAINPLYDLGDKLQDMHNRINNGHQGAIDDPLQIARDCIVAAKELSDFSLRMFNAHEIKAMQDELDKPGGKAR